MPTIKCLTQRSCLGTLLFLWAFQSVAVAHGVKGPEAFLVDKESCSDAGKLEKCATSDIVYFECPVACSTQLSKEFAMRKTKETWQFYELELQKRGGETIEMETFEGYVTLYTVVPLLPGMAQFYYELLEYVQSLYPYSVAPVILPIKVDKESPVNIQPHIENGKTILLKKADKLPAALQTYLDQSDFNMGSEDMEVLYDRVTVFIFAPDGIYYQKLTSPTLKELRRSIDIMAEVKDHDFRQIRSAMGRGEL